MAKKKILYLGIIHTIQMHKPDVKEIINNPMYEQDLKEAIAKYKDRGNLAKAVNKVAVKHIKKVKMEYAYLTDNINSKNLKGASVIIDVDNKQLIKNRFEDADKNEIVDLYLRTYQDKIDEFNKKYGTNHG